jgi:hypothetical protein
MLSNDYHFITHWQIEGTVEEVSKILEDTASLLRWWPSVYLELQVLDPGDEIGRGKVVRLKTEGGSNGQKCFQLCLVIKGESCSLSFPSPEALFELDRPSAPANERLGTDSGLAGHKLQPRAIGRLGRHKLGPEATTREIDDR